MVGGVIRGEIVLGVHELRDQLGEGREVLNGGRFDADRMARGSKITGRFGHGRKLAVSGGTVRWNLHFEAPEPFPFPDNQGSRGRKGAISSGNRGKNR